MSIRTEIDALEDRVEELEARILAPEIRTMKVPSPTPTETGRILVDPDEYERLQRVDNAARNFSLWMKLRPGETTTLHRGSSILEPIWESLKR